MQYASLLHVVLPRQNVSLISHFVLLFTLFRSLEWRLLPRVLPTHISVVSSKNLPLFASVSPDLDFVPGALDRGSQQKNRDICKACASRALNTLYYYYLLLIIWLGYKKLWSYPSEVF